MLFAGFRREMGLCIRYDKFAGTRGPVSWDNGGLTWLICLFSIALALLLHGVLMLS